MTAFEKSQSITVKYPDAGNIELGKRIYQLFEENSLDCKAALSALKVIPMKSEVGKKWLKCWTACILLEMHRFEPTSKDNPKRERKARRILNGLIPARFGGHAADETEMIFKAMWMLGSYDLSSADHDNRARACTLLAQLVALTRFYSSPLNELAEEWYQTACEELPRRYFEMLNGTPSNASQSNQETKAALQDDAA